MAGDGLFETTSIPGHLAPTPERLERLLAKQTLEELYEVEEQPFARGKYATVRRCRERSSGQQWAAKFLRKRRRAQELRAEALHEVAVLDAAAHCPRLVSLHQVFETSTEMVLVLELAPGGELQMVLDRDEIPEERQVAKLLRQILDGVAFLHSLNVAHLDIKPQNLVLTGEFPDCDVKLCDFGISRYISQGADIREILGTPDYIAPEVLNYEPISLATDMWSVGVLLYVLLTGCSPFGGDTKQETFCNISRCKLDFPDDLFEDVSEEAQDLIRRLIVKNPSERLSAAECLEHSWLSKFEDVSSPMSLFVSEVNEILEDETAACDNTSSSFSSASLPPIELPSSPSPIADSIEETTATSTTCIENATTVEEQLPVLMEPRSEPRSESRSWLEESRESIADVLDDSEATSTSNDKLLDATTSPDVTADSVETDGTDDRRHHHHHLLDEEEKDDGASTDRCSDTNSNHSSSMHSSRSEYSFTRRLNSTMPMSSSTTKHQFNGLSTERRTNFKRSMDYLARKFSASADLLEVFDDLEIETSSRRSSVNAMSTSVSEVFKCSPVFILGEEQQCSDSGSDTVSEISTDSSSDRSSIYSDDSLDFILYGKTSQGRVSFPFSASESHNWKQRNGIIGSNNNSPASGLRHGPRVWPRECNGVVSKALSRFTTSSVDHHHHHHHLSTSSSIMSTSTSNGNGGNGSSNSSNISNISSSSSNHGKSPISVTASSSTSSSISIASSSMTRTSTTRSITGLEALRNRGENLVVIREPVRAGRYMRYSEVQCESVQARIRRFQVHGSS